jgi:hypothetical protein
LIQDHKPLVVVIYAMTPIRVWRQLVLEAGLEKRHNRIAVHQGANERDYHVRQATTSDGRLYLMMWHPSRYNSHGYQDAVAARVRQHLVAAAERHRGRSRASPGALRIG